MKGFACIFFFSFLLVASAQTEWTTYPAGGIPAQAVNVFFEDSRGNFWIGTKAGISVFSGDQWNTIAFIEDKEKKTEEPVGSIVRFWEDGEGKVWAAGEGRLSVYDGSSFEYYRDRYYPGYTVKFFLSDSRNEVWLCSEKREVNRYENLLSKPQINGTVARLSSSVWLSYGLEAGGSHYVQSGDPEEYYTGIVEDRRGYIWVGTVEGLNVFAGTDWISIRDEILSSVYVTGLITDPAGQVWVATLGGVAVFNGTVWKEYRKNDGLGGNMVRRIVAGTDGSIWAYIYGNTEFEGLSRFQDGSWTFYPSGRAFPGGAQVSEPGDLTRSGSFLTRTGFAFFDGSGWTAPGKEQGLYGKRFFCMDDDSEGTIWICTDHGLFSGDGRHFTGKHAWEPLDWEPSDILCDSRNRVWITGRTGGVMLLENGQSRYFGPENGMSVEKPSEITEDHSGRIWVIGTREVALFKMQ